METNFGLNFTAFNILFAFKTSIIVAVVIYLIFSLVSVKQSHLLGSVLKTNISPLLSLFPLLLTFAAIFLLLFAVLMVG